MARWPTWSAVCDHTIFIAEVEEVVVREGQPLLFFRGKYRRVGADVEK
jgi:flavin reductase (DIM6/NTAB) family NADH-FMN oxidoreductase RutF